MRNTPESCRSDARLILLAETGGTPISELREFYTAALGHDVSPTNLRRVVLRRGLLKETGQRRDAGRVGGRPAALFRFDSLTLAITDQFAVLRPPVR